MAQLRNNRHEKFALCLLKGMSQKDAAIEAGYKPSRAYQTASRLVRNGKVSERLQELQQAAEDASIASVIEGKQKLTEIARARISDFVRVDANGVHIIIDLVRVPALRD